MFPQQVNHFIALKIETKPLKSILLSIWHFIVALKSGIQRDSVSFLESSC